MHRMCLREYPESVIRQLIQIASEQKAKDAIEQGGVSRSFCKTKFAEAIGRRHERLKAIEINRILQGMLQIAYADGEIDGLECEAFGTRCAVGIRRQRQ